MKKSKEYKKMIKKYKKMIRNDAKDASIRPWDYGFGLQMFIDHLYFMRDYYALGENVWALEDQSAPTREQILNMILAAYEDWQNCEHKYVIYVDVKDKEKVQLYTDLGYYKYTTKLLDKLEVIAFHKYKDQRETYSKMSEDYARQRKKFFELLGEYIEFLWD